ncbi:hypothetical protein ACNOYE_24095 [Nannocystaceae bacterium ST9]
MARKPRTQQNDALLSRLLASGFEFCIVGGVAAALFGCSRMTVDLDLAAPFDVENMRRLLAAIADLDPRHATRPDLRILDEPLDRLVEARLLLIETDLGRLDVLREVSPIGVYPALRTVELTLGDLRCKVITLDQLIEIKQSLTRPKDREVALELAAIRERLRG